MKVSGGSIDVLTSYEGLEGSDILISGGTIQVDASDDGVNAAGGTDGSGFGGRDMGKNFAGDGSSHTLTISGGELSVNAGGDGLDSNGAISMTGGTVQVFSTGNGDGAIDSESGFTLEGGVLLACDTGRMSGIPQEATQCAVFINLGATLEAGTFVQLAGESQSFVFRMAASVATVLFSSPELVQGGTYTISYGGDYTGGDETSGLCSGGTYSGGTQLTEVTLTDLVTSYGQTGMGGGKGAMGGKGPMDGGMGDHPGRGTPPPNGTDTPPEGTEAPRPFPTDKAAPTI